MFPVIAVLSADFVKNGENTVIVGTSQEETRILSNLQGKG